VFEWTGLGKVSKRAKLYRCGILDVNILLNFLYIANNFVLDLYFCRFVYLPNVHGVLNAFR